MNNRIARVEVVSIQDERTVTGLGESNAGLPTIEALIVAVLPRGDFDRISTRATEPPLVSASLEAESLARIVQPLALKVKLRAATVVPAAIVAVLPACVK